MTKYLSFFTGNNNYLIFIETISPFPSQLTRLQKYGLINLYFKLIMTCNQIDNHKKFKNVYTLINQVVKIFSFDWEIVKQNTPKNNFTAMTREIGFCYGKKGL